jgi:ribosomal protein S17
VRNTARILAAAFVVAFAVAGCKKKVEEIPPSAPPPEAAAPAPIGSPVATEGSMTGTVLETMGASSYTYVKVETADGTIWAAAPKFEVKVGDRVTVPEGMPMENYHSEGLDRDFDLVYFVSEIAVGDQPLAGAGAPATPGDLVSQPMPEGLHPKVDPAQAAAEAKVDFSGIAKADQKVADLYGSREKLSGADVAVRGKVVKFSPQIMGKNWIHLQDGSGAAGTNDLTVTTSGEAKVGDTVLVRGKLTVDKDFGMGYRYDLIIEDAAVTVE